MIFLIVLSCSQALYETVREVFRHMPHPIAERPVQEHVGTRLLSTDAQRAYWILQPE